MENCIYHISEDLSLDIHKAVKDIHIPLDKKFVFFPPKIFWKINNRLKHNVALKRLKEFLIEHLLYPYSNVSEGQGYVILDGLYPYRLYPEGINAYNYNSKHLAPFDEIKNRAFDLQVDLIEEPLLVYIAMACLVGIPFRVFGEKTLVSPIAAYPAINSARHGGMGENLLHKDTQFLVPFPTNILDLYTLGPGAEVTGFLVINKDRFDFGVTWILRENVKEIMGIFNKNELDILKSPIFFYEPAYNINDTKSLEKFPIFYKDFMNKWRLRFSGKVRSYMASNWPENDNEYKAINKKHVLGLLQEINQEASNHSGLIEVLLDPGQIIFFNNIVTMHGRGIVKDKNRLLAHVFIRVPHLGSSKNAIKYFQGGSISI